MTLISSLHSGPFSVCHNVPDCGSNAKPNEFRSPYEKIRLSSNGLSCGALPLRFMRSTLPASFDKSCALEGLWPSPTTA